MTVKVFLCHHENDAGYCDELSKHLKAAERGHQIELWHRRRVQVGEDVRSLVDEKLEQADLVLVLMSADLLDCDYCWGVEVSAALQRHRAGRARLVPVVLGACDWQACLPELRPVPATSAPIVVEAGRIEDARFLEAAGEIMSAVRALEAAPPDEATRVTSMRTLVAELQRLELQSGFSVAEAADGLLRLSAGLRYLAPSTDARFFAEEAWMSRNLQEDVPPRMKRLYAGAYRGPRAPSQPPFSQPPPSAEGASPAVDVLRAAVHEQEGDYIKPTVRLVSRLGAGGMGSVWLAENLKLGTPVAVKLMLPQHLANAELRQRFKQEAHILARIQSPHVVQVLDYGETPAGDPYILMELLDGETLKHRLESLGPLPLPDVVQIVTQAASALSEAHAFGIIHRDLKPDNLFLIRVGGELFVKVIDFGIAKLPKADLDKVLTLTGQPLGTPSYMSPEAMLNSSNVDPRADVWALAAVAYEALTGQRPFQRKSFMEAVLATHVGVFPMPSALKPGLPEAIDAWAERALKSNPAERFGTVREAADAFREAAGATSLATTTPVISPLQHGILPPAPVHVAMMMGTPPSLPVERPLHADVHHAAPTLVSQDGDVFAQVRQAGKNEGHIQAVAWGILAVLRARGVEVREAARQLILSENDPERLGGWLEKAAVAVSVDEVLGAQLGE